MSGHDYLRSESESSFQSLVYSCVATRVLCVTLNGHILILMGYFVDVLRGYLNEHHWSDNIILRTEHNGKQNSRLRNWKLAGLEKFNFVLGGRLYYRCITKLLGQASFVPIL